MSKHTAALIVGILVVILSIIHLGVGIGLTAKYSVYKSVLQLSYGLAAYNIAIGLFGLAVGALAVFAVLKQNRKLCKETVFSKQTTSSKNAFYCRSTISNYVFSVGCCNNCFVYNRTSYQFSID